LAVRQVIFLSSLVVTSASTVKVPYCRVSISSTTRGKGCTYWGDFSGQVNVLVHAHIALLERALEVGLANRLAAVRLLVDQSDQAILYLQVHREALLNLLLEVA
jgi:hypothetical protein